MFNRHKLIAIMNEKNITMYKLWKLSGIAQSTISNIINNDGVSPKSDTLSKFANVLGCTVDEFFDNNEQPIDKINKNIKDSGLTTIAQHYEGEKFTEEDKEDIDNFIKFVLSKKHKKK